MSKHLNSVDTTLKSRHFEQSAISLLLPSLPTLSNLLISPLFIVTCMDLQTCSHSGGGIRVHIFCPDSCACHDGRFTMSIYRQETKRRQLVSFPPRTKNFASLLKQNMRYSTRYNFPRLYFLVPSQILPYFLPPPLQGLNSALSLSLPVFNPYVEWSRQSLGIGLYMFFPT